MRLAMVLGLAVSVTAMAAGQTPPPSQFEYTMMPQPAQFTVQSGRLPITATMAITASKFHDDRLDAAIARTERQLAHITGIEFETASPSGPAIQVAVDGPGERVQSVDEDESYSLAVTDAGVKIHAVTVVGGMRGLVTLLQLVQSDAQGFFLPAISIQDHPRFRWRGLMIDCGRHFEPIDVIKRTLDGMAAVKLNVFHWHLTEDQGFRIESKLFPKLTGLGSDGEFYTQDQAREIVAYARARGIRVVPEFDMPGHTQSWLVGYPDLTSDPGAYKIERSFGIFDPVMDPTRESTYKFLDAFIGEMAAIFPDEYMHIGGDEVNGVQWRANPHVQAFMQQHGMKDTAALQAYFNQRLLPILKKHGKRMVGWDEVLTPGLPKDVVVQSWRGFDSLAAGTKQGYSGILSAGYYLDHMDTAAEHYLVDPIPAGSDLTAEEQARILGGEACMWGEFVDARIIDSRIWPRTAAIAERLWSPQNVRNVDEMYSRLWVESLRLESLGLTQISQEDASLRQLAGTEQINSLKVLASVLEPVKFGERESTSRSTQLTPLVHLIDALPPDPPSRHGFAVLVRGYLENPRARTQEQATLAIAFQSWMNAEGGVMQLADSTPLLAGARLRAQQLTELGTLGIEAISWLSSGQQPPQGWKAQKLAVLDAAAQPSGMVRFTVLGPLRDLVEAAGGK